MAVKLTGWPTLLGFGDDVSVVLVAAWPTIWVNTGEVMALKLLSPP